MQSVPAHMIGLKGALLAYLPVLFFVYAPLSILDYKYSGIGGTGLMGLPILLFGGVFSIVVSFVLVNNYFRKHDVVRPTLTSIAVVCLSLLGSIIGIILAMFVVKTQNTEANPWN